MNKKEIKLGMKVWYEDDEWEVVFIKNNLVNLRKFNKNKEVFSGMVKIKDLKPLDEFQTSINPTMFNTEKLVDECYKDYWIVRIFKKLFR